MSKITVYTLKVYDDATTVKLWANGALVAGGIGGKLPVGLPAPGTSVRLLALPGPDAPEGRTDTCVGCTWADWTGSDDHPAGRMRWCGRTGVVTDGDGPGCDGKAVLLADLLEVAK